MSRYLTVLSVAGSDSCAGAGLQADLKTIMSLGLYAATAVTAVTAQNTLGVSSVMPVTPGVLRDQVMGVMDDMHCDAIKSGMLCNEALVRTLSSCLMCHKGIPYVLDPVMISTSGTRLLGCSTQLVADLLFPLATVVTPNIPEAEAFSGIKITSDESMAQAAESILAHGCGAVVIKGGHGQGSTLYDSLFLPGGSCRRFAASNISTRNTHGTGCTFASATASFLAMGHDVADAVERAHNYTHQAIAAAASVSQGGGHGSLMHFFNSVRPKLV